MQITKLENGDLRVPFAKSTKEFIGDGYKIITPQDSDYQKYLEDYYKQLDLEKELKEIAKKNPDYRDAIEDW